MNRINYVNPKSHNNLEVLSNALRDPDSGDVFPIISAIPRFCSLVNYADSFAMQWNLFDRTQIDVYSGCEVTEQRFYSETNWTREELSGQTVLEVGCGAGRFSEVILRTTTAQLYSVDYSNAVEVNYRNNFKYRDRLRLAQASIYELPFRDEAFDKVFCFGVLQHTPSFCESVVSLIRKTKKEGKIAVDFYPINGWYTKIHSKYLLRPLTKRLGKQKLLSVIRFNIRWMLTLFDVLVALKLQALTRFIPIADVRNFPKNLSTSQRLEWAVLDTFDGFAPEFDNPQRLKDVVSMFVLNGCEVTYAGAVAFPNGSAMVVRATKKSDY